MAVNTSKPEYRGRDIGALFDLHLTWMRDLSRKTGVSLVDILSKQMGEPFPYELGLRDLNRKTSRETELLTIYRAQFLEMLCNQLLLEMYPRAEAGLRQYQRDIESKSLGGKKRGDQKKEQRDVDLKKVLETEKKLKDQGIRPTNKRVGNEIGLREEHVERLRRGNRKSQKPASS